MSVSVPSPRSPSPARVRQLYTADPRATISPTLAVKSLDQAFSSSPALAPGSNTFSFPVESAGFATTTYTFTVVRSPGDTGSGNRLVAKLALRALPSGLDLPLAQRAAPGAAPDDTEGFNALAFNYSTAALADTAAVNVTATAHGTAGRTVGVLCPGAAAISLLPLGGGGVLCALRPGNNNLTVGQATNASAFTRPNETYAVAVSVPRPSADASLTGLTLSHSSAAGAFAPYPLEIHSAARSPSSPAPERCFSVTIAPPPPRSN